MQFAFSLNEKIVVVFTPFCLLAILDSASQVFSYECLIETPESIWVPFPLLGVVEPTSAGIPKVILESVSSMERINMEFQRVLLKSEKRQTHPQLRCCNTSGGSHSFLFFLFFALCTGCGPLIHGKLPDRAISWVFVQSCSPSRATRK